MSGEWRKIETPLTEEIVESLCAGDHVLLTGTLYTARDQAHRRIAEMTARGEALPFDLAGQVIYYTGPSPAPPGRPVGSAGPTTSSRMDPFTDVMLKLGIRGMIGKGRRVRYVREILSWYRAVYFATYGGAGAYLAMRIREAEVAAFEDLGPEAVYRLRVEEFPLIVASDAHGGDLYEPVIQRR